MFIEISIDSLDFIVLDLQGLVCFFHLKNLFSEILDNKAQEVVLSLSYREEQSSLIRVKVDGLSRG